MVEVSRLGIVPEEGIKAPFRVETDGPITLEGNQIIRGYQTVSGNRVLVKDQVDASENGLYNTLDGEWKRASDMDRPEDVQANVWMVSQETGLLYEIVIAPGTYWNPGATDINFATASGLVLWGGIGGTLSDQTDLQAALDAKLNLAGGTVTGDLTVSGAFTSVGIDDNATAKRVQLDNISMEVGATSADFRINKPDTAGALFLSGGNIADDGGNILLYGSTRSTLAGDVRLRSGSNVFLDWDESAGDLTFSTGVGAKSTALTFDASQNATFAGTIIYDGAGGTSSLILNGSSTHSLQAGVAGAASFLTAANTAAAGSALFLRTDNASGVPTNALILDSNQNATFEGNVNIETPNATTLTIEGDGSGFINAATRYIANQANNVRGLGDFAYNVNDDTEWFWGRGYSTNDQFEVIRATGNLGPSDTTSDAGDANSTQLFSISNTGNATFAGKVNTPASAATRSGFNIDPGVAPTTPANGDIWTTTAGVFARVNGVTNQLDGGGIGGSIADNQVAVGATTADDIEGSAALTFDGTEVRTTGYFTVNNAAPEIRIEESDEGVGDKNWRWRAFGQQLTLNLADDTYTSSSNVLYFSRSGNTMTEMGINTADVTLTTAGGTLSFQEATSAATGLGAGKGRLWVRNDDPNVLVFKDDAGTDWDLNVAGGGIGGSIADNQVAVGAATADDVEGDPGLIFTSGGKVLTVGNGTTSAPSVIVSAASTGSPRILFLQSGGASADLQLNNSQSEYQLTSFGASLDIAIQPNGVNSMKFLAASSKAVFEKGYAETAVSLTGTAVDCDAGTYFYKTFTGATTLTFTNPAASGKVSSFTMELTNASTNITWPASVKWAGGTQPTWSTTGVDIVSFVTRDGGTTWYGFLGGLAFA